ncbi:hypothetical protein NDU88_003567 [Pleurodeles waltl]|uniref:Uncharacterized protein n=1 Tax=Pleurodeles waltl TaxID=8319 RepID=A0AAV7T5B5_PLEWA|nr:hypothetical protein NDU88_003567 [Pleurodeles waltl]
MGTIVPISLFVRPPLARRFAPDTLAALRHLSTSQAVPSGPPPGHGRRSSSSRSADRCLSEGGGEEEDAPDRRSERGGRQDRRPKYVKEKKDSPQSTIKKEEKTPQQKPQFEKKKVAALTAKNASILENTVEEQDVGSDSVRQRGRGHDMSPESERSSGCDSN